MVAVLAAPPASGVLKSLKDLGMNGNGVADNTTVWNTIMAAALPGDIFWLEAGTYLLPAITIPAGVTVLGSRFAIIKTKNGTNNVSVTIAANAKLKGVTVDGNRANQTANGNGVVLAGANAEIEDCNVHGCFGYGITSANFSYVKAIRCDVSDTRFQGIFFESTSALVLRPVIDRCNVDRSAEGAGVQGTGITVKGIPSFPIRHAQVTVNDVKMPTNGGNGAICIELDGGSAGLGGVFLARCNGNTTSGGAMGISASGCDKSSINGNPIFNAVSNGIELASARGCSVVGNPIDGNNFTANGIQSSNASPTQNTISANVIIGCVTRGLIVANGNYTAITGNTIDMASANYAVEIILSQHFTFTGNTLKGNGTATKGLVLNSSYNCQISGGSIHNFTEHGILIYSTAALTLDNIAISTVGFVSTGTPVGTQLSGGAVLGNQVSIIGCPGYSGAGYLNMFDLKNLIMDVAGTGSPEGVAGAGVGSIWRNLSGGATTTWWVKTSGGSGNTGWTALT